MKIKFPSKTGLRFASATVAAFAILSPLPALANHDVLVEGEQDFDNDGRVGASENTDGDQIFGTIGAALAGGNRTVIIVTSGRFAEVLNISTANGVPGNIKLTAAPGVEAVIGAVLTGPDPRAALFNVGGSTNATRQAATGITVDLPATQRVILSNLNLTNYATGIAIRNESHVTVENCRINNNNDFGIFVGEQSAASILNSEIVANGYRAGLAVAPSPGDGVFFEGASTGLIANSSLIGNLANGATNNTGDKKSVETVNVVAFDNGKQNFEVTKVKKAN